MADNKYKGRERRSEALTGISTRRRGSSTSYDDLVGMERSKALTRLEPEESGIITIKQYDANPDRRFQGAGRRKGDFTRAMRRREAVVFNISKTPKSVFKTGTAGKLAKKAAKRLPAIGVAVGIYDLVNRSKQ